MSAGIYRWMESNEIELNQIGRNTAGRGERELGWEETEDSEGRESR